MAAPLGSQNALGNSGGKSLQDRKLAAEVRGLALRRIKSILEHARIDMVESERELHDALLIKLAGTVLPRLSEVTGEDGAPLIIQMAKSIADKNGIDVVENPDNEPNTSTGEDSSGQTQVQSS